jgi:hypothetical protein
MVKLPRVGSRRWQEIVKAEEEFFPGYIGRSGRLEEQRIVRSLERLVKSVGLNDLRIEVRVSPRRGSKNQGIEVKITGPCRGAALRAIRGDLRRLKQAK